MGCGDALSRGDRVGSEGLYDAIVQRPNIRLFCFGHIHENYGYVGRINKTTAINCSVHDERYNFIREGIQIITVHKNEI
jgi:Icc-related predicted phosphoesterase